MAIKLMPLERKKRDKVTPVGGKSQNIVRVLVIAMLDPNKLYSAKEVAATAWNPSKEQEMYEYHRKGFNNWASKQGNGIAQTPDNLTSEGKKMPGQPARWLGSTWQSHVADIPWNKAVCILDKARVLNENTRIQKRKIFFYWDEQNAEIIQENELAFREMVISVRQKLSPNFNQLLVVAGTILILATAALNLFTNEPDGERGPSGVPINNRFPKSVAEYTKIKLGKDSENCAPLYDMSVEKWYKFYHPWYAGKKMINDPSIRKNLNLYIGSIIRDQDPLITFDPPSIRGG